MRLGRLVNLWKLSRLRLRSEQDYRRFQACQAALLTEYLEINGVRVKGSRVLDLGSGIGGYSVELARQGASVISLDLIKPSLEMPEGCTRLMASALAIPLRPATVDFVFCASLIEHVPDPAALLAEIKRTLVPGGYCYLSFPPFYSPLGGHEFAPFHYLGERWALRLAGRRLRRQGWARDLYGVDPNPASFSEVYQASGLYKMTIARARRLIAASGLLSVDLSTRYLPLNPARWPVVGEVLTWHVQFLLVKPIQEDLGGQPMI